MVHALYRSIALYRAAKERRVKPEIAPPNP
jgi:hypothetical protein